MKLKFKRHDGVCMAVGYGWIPYWHAKNEKHNYTIRKFGPTTFQMHVDNEELSFLADSFNHAKQFLNNHASRNYIP